MMRQTGHTLKNRLNKSSSKKDAVTIVEPRSYWKIVNLNELKEYRDLFFFLVWRDIKVLYAQTILGFSWAIIQPLTQIVIFTFVFGKIAKVSTDGIPYVLFSSVAIIPWTYMSQAMQQSSESLVRQQHVLGKIYFPRVMFPMTPILAKLIDFGVSTIIILGVAAYYRIVPTWNILLFPVFILLMVSISAGTGMWLSALAIRFRDVKYAMSFAIRMLMYSAPIVYSASSIPAKYRLIYSLNPIVSVIEGFRASLLGTPMPWAYIWPGAVAALILLITGSLYFHRMEHVFVDVI
jgi:lipopolysaccharide transport system permease protein